MAEKSPTNTSTKPRPPIVVVMGHVDHGKTTLLDTIRKASYGRKAATSTTGEPRSVAEREAGGITQSIGAYEIDHSGRRMTFIDTPGHEAFSKMRSCGANVADLAILVVAADEGLKPQTKESIKILNDSKTPFVVGITKIDKPGADLEKVKNELTSEGVLLEGYGGSVSYQPVSAKTGEHMDELLDLLLLAADLENLTYDPHAKAEGFVLEAKVDRKRGLEATVIVKNGTLKQGEALATATAKGKIKILEDFLGKTTKALEPSAPALIIGFETLPQVGEQFSADVAQIYAKPVVSGAPARAAAGEGETLNLTLKGADTGALEALSGIVHGLASKKPIRITGESVGDVNDNDVKLAISTGSIIIAFRSRTDKGPKTLADANGVQIISSDIVYELVTAIEEFIAELERPKSAGEIEVLAVFNQSKPERQVVGGKVTRGIFKNKSAVKIVRSDPSTSSGQVQVAAGRVMNLQQQKKDAGQVGEGNECGLLISSTELIKVGDKLVTEEVGDSK